MSHITMSDEERSALAAKLDADLDAYIKQNIEKTSRKRAKQQPEREQTIDEIYEELQSHPAFLKEIDPSKPLHPLVEGLQELKYNTEDAYDNADSYKEEGNYSFKHKLYSNAITSYTAGIRQKAADRLINAQLFSNRAAAHFHKENYRSAFYDCVVARKFKPDHYKAIFKGIQCCMGRRRYDDAIRWCEDALMFDPSDKKVLAIRKDAEKRGREQERDRRRMAAKRRKQRLDNKQLIETIKGRGVKLAVPPQEDSGAEEEDVDPIDLSCLESHHPSGAKVSLAEDGSLRWPVVFMYPEYGTSDFIEQYGERSTFGDHMAAMFGSGDVPPWDEHAKYKPNNLQVYFEDKEEEALYAVDPNTTLSQALGHHKMIVHGGTPAFILLVPNSPFAEHFLPKYKLYK